MRLKITAAFVVCALSLSLFACSPGPKQASVTVTCDDFAREQNIMGAVKTPFPAGKSFTVGLCSDPSTGLQWQESATISDQSVAQQTAHELVSGQEIWTFIALSEGGATLSWSTLPGGGEVQRTFRLVISVQ